MHSMVCRQNASISSCSLSMEMVVLCKISHIIRLTFYCTVEQLDVLVVAAVSNPFACTDQSSAHAALSLNYVLCKKCFSISQILWLQKSSCSGRWIQLHQLYRRVFSVGNMFAVQSKVALPFDQITHHSIWCFPLFCFAVNFSWSTEWLPGWCSSSPDFILHSSYAVLKTV